MKPQIPFYVLSAILLSCPAMLHSAQADETVSTTTTTTQAPAPAGGRIINVSEFDLNKDGILSTYEIGEMLFKFFDTDSSGSIDATEYEHKGILTVVPMEKSVTVTYDLDNDGVADTTQYTFETFTQNTQLARFDKNKDGLSPHEFADKTFAEADADSNKGVDLTEWRNAYISRLAPVPGQ